MIRAGIFIGVDKTGSLQRLNDAAAGAKRMHEWALAQGMVDQTEAKLITDEGGRKVTPDEIYDAIQDILNGAGADQLILYFAGHGVNINRSEHWLLTDAPVRTSAAVNVAGSVELARYCGIGHVAVISDACRVAADGIQAQNVRGMDVFPNESASDKAKPVDQFFACVLGRTAAEIKDPSIAAAGFTALYTNILLEALYGGHPELLDPSGAENDPAYYVHPVKLESYLEREVPVRVRALQLENKVNQNPDAIITAHNNWLAKIDSAPRVVRRAVPRAPTPPALRTLSQDAIRTAVEGAPAQLDRAMEKMRIGNLPGAESYVGTAADVAAPFGPDHFETGCGVKVRGASIVQFAIARGSAELLGSAGDLLRISPEMSPASLLLRFEGNFGAVIPAVPGYLAALTFNEGELVDIAYEPSTNNTVMWPEYMQRADDLRRLRGVAAAASQHGRFRLNGLDQLETARRFQYAKGIDPTLAVYAAYAYHDLQRIDLIREMTGYMRDAMAGWSFFDLAMLGRELLDMKVDRSQWIVPFVPMFSQGWPLLRANRIKLHPELDGIERTLRESVWSLFDGNGVDRLERALRSGEVQ